MLGLAGTASSLLVVSALDLQVAAAGTAWLLLGMATYIAYRRRQGLDLVSTHKVAIPEPVVDHEAEYDSVLVHVGDGRFDEQLLATATKLAARKPARHPRARRRSPCPTRSTSTRRWRTPRPRPSR